MDRALNALSQNHWQNVPPLLSMLGIRRNGTNALTTRFFDTLPERLEVFVLAAIAVHVFHEHQHGPALLAKSFAQALLLEVGGGQPEVFLVATHVVFPVLFLDAVLERLRRLHQFFIDAGIERTR